jgi:hypothetical protein
MMKDQVINSCIITYSSTIGKRKENARPIYAMNSIRSTLILFNIVITNPFYILFFFAACVQYKIKIHRLVVDHQSQ